MQNRLVLIFLVFSTLLASIKCVQSVEQPYIVFDPEDVGQDYQREDTSCPVGKYPGIFWDGQKCDSCYSKECFCKSYQGCDSCTDYYSKNIYGKCQECEAIYLGGENGYQQALSCCFDSKCNFPISAVNCEEGAQKFGGVCVKLDYCATYSLFGTCTKCESGYYLDNDQSCHSCERPFCAECSGPYMCKSCMPGYYLSAKEYTGSNSADSYKFGTCEPCSNNTDNFCICKTPIGTADPECSGCIPGLSGYYWDSVNKTCVNCQQNCTKCQNNVNCSVCDDGFYLNSNGGCSECSGNCFTCTFTNDIDKCNKDKCFNGFYFVANTSQCELCTQENAARCKGPTDLEITQCITTDIDKNTYFTNDLSYWFTHKDIYYLVEFTNITTKNKTKKCVINNGDCKSMQAIYDGVSDYTYVCNTCYTELGYVLLKNDSSCYKCDDETVGKQNCTKCHSGDADIVNLICDTCYTGGDISDLQYTQWWEKNESNFQSNVIIGPVDNYYLDKSDTTTADAVTCSPCSVGCKTCISTEKCTACQKGYRLDSELFECVKCDNQQCLDCKTSKDQCITCFPGYRKYTDPDTDVVSCQPCSVFCLKCDGNQDVCTQCYSGNNNTYDYYLSNGQCLEKRVGCIMGSANGDCVLCDYGFRIVDGWCHKCGMVNSDGSDSLAYVNCYDYCQSKSYLEDGDSSSTGSNTDISTGGTDAQGLRSIVLSFTYVLFTLVLIFLMV